MTAGIVSHDGPALLHVVELQTAFELRCVVESPATGVVLIDLDIPRFALVVPLHWRAGRWTKPPLDVRFAQSGDLLGVQFVVQDEQIEAGDELPPSRQIHGWPRFDVRRWHGTDRYIDVAMDVQAVRTPADRLVLRLADAAVDYTIVAGPQLEVAVSALAEVVALAIGPLTRHEWDVVAKAASTGNG